MERQGIVIWTGGSFQYTKTENKIYIRLTGRRFEFGSFATFRNCMQCNGQTATNLVGNVSIICSSIIRVFSRDKTFKQTIPHAK